MADTSPPADALPSAEGRPLAGNIPRYYAYRFCVYAYLWMPVWVVYLTEGRGLTLTQVALLSTFGWLLLAAPEVPTGAVADLLGYRPTLTLGATLFGVGVWAYGSGETLPALAGATVLWMLGTALMSGADTALVYASLKAEGREPSYRAVLGRGLSVMYLANILGSLAGAPLAALDRPWRPWASAARRRFCRWFRPGRGSACSPWWRSWARPSVRSWTTCCSAKCPTPCGRP